MYQGTITILITFKIQQLTVKSSLRNDKSQNDLKKLYVI
jgi:hypothetical protein